MQFDQITKAIKARIEKILILFIPYIRRVGYINILFVVFFFHSLKGIKEYFPSNNLSNIVALISKVENGSKEQKKVRKKI